MRRVLCLLLSWLWASTAFAAGVDCTAAKDLTKQFLSFDAANATPDYVYAKEKIFTGAYSIMRSYDHLSPNTPAAARQTQFACVVDLGIAAYPWDGEGESLETFIQAIANPTLNKVYESELAHFPDQCRSKLLRETVASRKCHDDYEKAHKLDDSVCDKYFADTDHFKECLSAKHPGH